MTLASLPIYDPTQGPGRSDPGPVIDPQGRGIGYLRLSLTRSCSMRCTYCRPEKIENARNEQRLSVEEIGSVVSHLRAHHGLRKVRLTGGDPTSRPELIRIIQTLSRVSLDDLAMTTNGLTLAKRAKAYRDAGLHRVNISLDTLDRDRFTELTGVDGLSRVLAGIEAARDAGLGPIKLNCVVVRDQNTRDLPDLVRYAAEENLSLRFIELMPMGPLADAWEERYVPEPQIRQVLSDTVASYTALPQGHDAARRYRAQLHDGRVAEIGFITPMSCNFCSDCNRLRLAADGAVYPCLMDRPAGSILAAVRPRFDADAFDHALHQAYAHKQSEHPAFGYGVMTHLGG